VALSPDQHRAALERRGQEEAGFLESLARQVQNEQRNDSWAREQETALRRSYAADPRLPQDALRTIDCRSSKCELQLQISSQRQPSMAADQYHAVNSWISAQQPCGYTLSAAPLSAAPAGTTQIFLDCGRP
jgi:hypothetical protein